MKKKTATPRVLLDANWLDLPEFYDGADPVLGGTGLEVRVNPKGRPAYWIKCADGEWAYFPVSWRDELKAAPLPRRMVLVTEWQAWALKQPGRWLRLTIPAAHAADVTGLSKARISQLCRE